MGQRFLLPRRAAVIYDLFHKKVLSQDIDQFTVYLEAASTNLFYTGDQKTLDRLDVNRSAYIAVLRLSQQRKANNKPAHLDK